MLQKYLTLLILAALFASCQKENLEVQEPDFYSKNFVQTEYPKILSRLDLKRKSLKPNFYNNKASRLKSAKKSIETVLADQIFPMWMGTDWDFNGTTTKPREGSIACGYFVTTTLNQCGFEFNRNKLAQQAASYIISSFCKEENIKRIGHNNTKALMRYLNQQEDRIFLCGLDNHIGYIVKYDDEWYAVHASGLSPYAVVKEKLEGSKAFMSSNNFYVAPLFKEGYMLSSWVLDVPVAIKTK